MRQDGAQARGCISLGSFQGCGQDLQPSKVLGLNLKNYAHLGNLEGTLEHLSIIWEVTNNAKVWVMQNSA